MFPHSLKAECWQGPPSPPRGTEGPLSASPPRVMHPLTDAVLRACAEVGMATRAEYCGGDLLGAFPVDGTTREGRRCSTRTAYLDPGLRLRGVDALRVIDVSIMPKSSRATPMPRPS